MARFLIIDTALEQAIVAISENELILDELVNHEAHHHASFLQVAIANLMEKNGLQLAHIDAIVVTLGPGSYTGLRVGLASAKGIAYTLQKPLIGISTLEALAQNAFNHIPINLNQAYQVFSMIDARRMEVFGAIYDSEHQSIVSEQAMLLDDAKWSDLITKATVCIGNGAAKTKDLKSIHEVYYLTTSYSSKDLLFLADKKYKKEQFEDLAYVGPNYLKEVYIVPSK